MSPQLYSTIDQVEGALKRNERDYQETCRRAEEGGMSGELFATLCAISTQERMLLNFQKYILNLNIDNRN